MSTPAVSQVPGGPFAAGTTPVYSALVVDPAGTPLRGSALDSLTLTIVDTLTGNVINDVDDINILNTDRGTIDEAGNLTIQLETGDTEISDIPPIASLRVQRSLVIGWSYNTGLLIGRQAANFQLIQLAA